MQVLKTANDFFGNFTLESIITIKFNGRFISADKGFAISMQYAA